MSDDLQVSLRGRAHELDGLDATLMLKAAARLDEREFVNVSLAHDLLIRENRIDALEAAIRDAIECIDGLAGQQAMTDRFYEPVLAKLQALLGEQP